MKQSLTAMKEWTDQDSDQFCQAYSAYSAYAFAAHAQHLKEVCGEAAAAIFEDYAACKMTHKVPSQAPKPSMFSKLKSRFITTTPDSTSSTNVPSCLMFLNAFDTTPAPPSSHHKHYWTQWTIHFEQMDDYCGRSYMHKGMHKYGIGYSLRFRDIDWTD